MPEEEVNVEPIVFGQLFGKIYYLTGSIVVK